MDAPGPGVVRDSQQSGSQLPLPINTPKSAGFGSPKPTQDSWTGPRRSQVRQIPKASFLADDDDSGEEADEQDLSQVITDLRQQFDNETDLDSTASEPDLEPRGESDADEDVFNDSPTFRTSQASHMPPQSAQPIPRSSRPDSSDPFSVFESLKRHPPAAAASQKPPQRMQTQKPGLGASAATPMKAQREPTTKDTAPRPKTITKKPLANSKVKIPALEVEEAPETGRPAIRKPQEYDYSLPASNSNSPAASPAKRKAAPKRQAMKKPLPKSKSNARKAKPASAGRVKKARAAPAPSSHSSTDAQSGGEENEIMVQQEETSVLERAPRKEELLGKAKTRAPTPGPLANEGEENQVVISSDPTSSFPESDNTDDEDFECKRKMTPANARRRTRAVAAESQARREATTKVEKNPPPPSSLRPPEIEDKGRQRNAAVRSKAQPKLPTKKAAVGKSQVIAAPGKSTLEPPTEGMQSSEEKIKEINQTSGRRAAANRVTKDKSHVKQDAVVSSNAKPAGGTAANKHLHPSEPGKKTESSIRKPNITAVGPGGPKNNGRSPKTSTTATINPPPEGQEVGLCDGESPRPSKTQLPKENPKAPTMQLGMTAQDRGSPTHDLGGNAESGLNRAARASQLNSGRVVPDHSPVPKTVKITTVSHSNAKMPGPKYEAECADTSARFVVGDAEDDTLVDDTINVEAESQGPQTPQVVDHLNETYDGEAFKPLAQHVKHPHMREHRTVLGEVDVNRRGLAKDAPPVIPHLMKRKLAQLTTVIETSPTQQPLTSKAGSQAEKFPTLRTDSTIFPSEGEARPIKKPRYNSVRSEDETYTNKPVGGPDNLSGGGGTDTGDDIFGPAKKGKPFGSSEFVQRLIRRESAGRGPGQAEALATASFDAHALPSRPIIANHHPAAGRSRAPEAVPHRQRNQALDDMGKRMLAALEPENTQVASPWPPSNERGEGFPGDDTNDSWPGDTLVQSKGSELDERTRVWKKATEPYAETLGETMHRIVNTVLRGLKANEAVIGDVVDDYRKEGQRVVERIADKHKKERALIIQQQERERLRHVQTYGEVRRTVEMLQGKLDSVDIDGMMLHVGTDRTTTRLKQLQQMITDA